ncbi:unnamed protein product [Gulo gulo]|uniref:Uncharacterized protein n=1 Tax=Gulo gulo TaxID=48420 RepID=A0A9X9LNX0_GULGU|nr:unnamed protein product [Gulo gulo]
MNLIRDRWAHPNMEMNEVHSYNLELVKHGTSSRWQKRKSTLITSKCGENRKFNTPFVFSHYTEVSLGNYMIRSVINSQFLLP